MWVVARARGEGRGTATHASWCMGLALPFFAGRLGRQRSSLVTLTWQRVRVHRIL